MKTLYFQCNMGAAGDMLAGALLELHPDPQGFLRRFNALGIPGVEAAAAPSVKCGITGTHFSVTVHGEEEAQKAQDAARALFGGGGNRPRQRRRDLGQAAGKYADLTILTMDNPRFEDMDDINRDIIEGLDVYNGVYQIIPDRKDAIHYVIDHCGKNDIVALIGKGHEEYQDVRGVKYPFSEEQVIREYLQTK